MEHRECYDIALERIAEASHKYGDGFAVSESGLEALKRVCNVADALICKIDCESVDIGVDETGQRFSIEIVCDEIILEYGRSRTFFDLMRMVRAVSFSKAGTEFIRITLIV